MNCKKKTTADKRRWGIRWLFLSLILISTYGCKGSEDDKVEVAPYNPNQPIEVTDFFPKEGNVKTQLILYGSNFGTEVDSIKVTIGGIKAPVVSAKGDAIYCMVPRGAYEGTIKLTIGKQTITVDKKFQYAKSMAVSTLCGEVDEKGRYDIKDGTFDDCGGFAEPTWFSFDPKNHNILYLAQDYGKPIRIFDLQNKTVKTGQSTGTAGLNRMRTITWTLDGDTMIVANDAGNEGGTTNVFLTRKGNFRDAQILSRGKQCNGSFIHPIDSALYYNSFAMGEVYRYDIQKWGVDRSEKKDFLFTIQDREWEFNMVVHPSGNYAYIVVINRNYILRVNYNKKRRSFDNPYIICGWPGSAGWVDKFGTNARLDHPYQGVFVKNPEYVKDGKEDVYDFYFCDRFNHCIRILTPDGLVTTFAGRGSASLDGNPYGYIDGDLRQEARFDQPCALAYDEASNTFYVGDASNHRIRTIKMEYRDNDTDEGETEGGETTDSELANK